MTSRQPPALAIATPDASPRNIALAKGLAATVFLILATAGGARLVQVQREGESLKQQTAASLKRSVIAVRPKPGDNARKLNLPASLRGSAESAVYARSNGYLSAWHKTIGDKVGKGELLATVDVPELEHELAQARAMRNQAKAKLDLAKSTLKRWEVLRKTDSAPIQEYEEKRSAVPQAASDLEAAEANLKRLEQISAFRRIVAPFSGVVSRRGVDVGNLISAGSQELFAVTQIDPLRLTVWVPQAYADDVKTGQEVAIKIPESQGKTVSAKIDHVAGALDPATRTRQVDITLPNKNGKLLPGAYVEVGFTLSGKSSALVIPANALVIDQTGPHVVAVNGEGKIGFRQVKLGRDFGREVEILDGVGADDVLVASPSDLLEEGEIVTAQEVVEKKPGEKTKAEGTAIKAVNKAPS